MCIPSFAAENLKSEVSELSGQIKTSKGALEKHVNISAFPPAPLQYGPLSFAAETLKSEVYPSNIDCGSPSSLYPPTPLARPTLLQYHCTTIGQYTPSCRPPFCMPWIIQY